eukprot:1136274-Pelagomonas_calceolata.AAC.2
MGRQDYSGKGIGIPSKPGEASALNFLKWDPTITSKTAGTVLEISKQSGSGTHPDSATHLKSTSKSHGFYLEAQPYLLLTSTSWSPSRMFTPILRNQQCHCHAESPLLHFCCSLSRVAYNHATKDGYIRAVGWSCKCTGLALLHIAAKLLL